MTTETAKIKPENLAKKWNGSSWIRKNKRTAIYLRDHFTCNYCGKDLHGAKPEDINLDHIVCRSHGGGNGAENLITACKACNSGRGNKKIENYATGGALERIATQTALELKPFITMANALLAGTTGGESEGER
jgi:5-methylcytosine-specific restriction endonuclease McrA